VVMRLHDEGCSLADIGKKVRKKPGTVTRILLMSGYKQDGLPDQTVSDHTLRPVERVVLKLRERGETYSQIGNRLARSGRRIQFIESLAEFKQNS
ncbi:MAG: helix-turn-helix domain-containing protein, partial [Acidimicrobiia bacterium]